ncbi:hypothetical protein ABH935_006712 [Catenulispora sp. GAS73]|uniref:hypothetical protein n=1 Tax=Catenulispora sp. GAS73 TaxID=3156269 RepID=UPI0035197890
MAARAPCAQIVIDYCESDTDDDRDPEEAPDGGGPPDAQEAAAEGPPWGRRPDRNGAGLTRAELARQMLDQGLPLAPRVIAETFHGTDQISRGQIESVRRTLRKLAAAGLA